MPIYLYHQPRHEPLSLTQVDIRNNGELRFYDNGNYVGFEAPALSANKIWVLPTADGNASDFLQTDGSGTLSWAAGSASDVKAGVDSGATADYVGAASNDGFLRTSAPLSYADGGNYITLGIDAATLTAAGKIEIATGTETNTGTDATRAVSPDGLDDWTGSAQITTVGTLSAGDVTPQVSAASLTAQGKIEIATGTETNTGTDATRAVSPDGLDDWTGSAQVTTVGTLSAGDVTPQVSAATTSAAGKSELAIASEVNTGTSTALAICPDGLAGSIHGTKVVVLKVMADDTALATGDGKMYFTVPIELNGMDLISVGAHVYTVSSSGLPTVQIHNLTDTADILSTVITIDENEKDSKDAATPAVINAAADDVVTGDELRIDIDVAGTGTKGLEIRLGFRIP